MISNGYSISNSFSMKASTYKEPDLHKHKRIHLLNCKDCSYHGINNKDLRRHLHTMHPQCNMCRFVGRNEDNLKHYMKESHPETLITCNTCQYKCFSEDQLGSHMRQNHNNSMYRTRIYSARRQSLSSSAGNEVFRPWSQTYDNPQEPPSFPNAPPCQPFSRPNKQNTQD